MGVSKRGLCPDAQQTYFVLWAFLSTFVMYCELLLFACYEYEHRQEMRQIDLHPDNPYRLDPPSLTLLEGAGSYLSL